jgi:hypothetical protein
VIRGTGESAHVCVKRVSGAVETENQGAAPGILRVGGLRVRDPYTLVLEGRPAAEARVYEWAQEAIVGFNGGWSGQRSDWSVLRGNWSGQGSGRSR